MFIVIHLIALFYSGHLVYLLELFWLVLLVSSGSLAMFHFFHKLFDFVHWLVHFWFTFFVCFFSSTVGSFAGSLSWPYGLLSSLVVFLSSSSPQVFHFLVLGSLDSLAGPLAFSPVYLVVHFFTSWFTCWFTWFSCCFTSLTSLFTNSRKSNLLVRIDT